MERPLSGHACKWNATITTKTTFQEVKMKGKNFFLIAMLAFAVLLFGYASQASASSSYYTSQGCSGCHGATATCNGCHQHGAHSSLNGAINITGTTDKPTYAPGDTVSVTINGGFKSGWIRAILYDQSMKELARSTGPTGMGGGAGYPVTLTAPAPTTPGTYTWNVSWFGNYMYNPGSFQTTCSSTRITNCWKPSSPANHGEEIVATNSFTVASSTPPPAPAISVTDSVAPATDLSVPFGSVNAGSSATQTVTVKNTGTASLAVGAIDTNQLAAPFSIKTDTCSNQAIAPTASCTITVAFAPTSTGSFTDSFNIPSNDPAKSSVTMNLTGNGTAVPTAAITVTDSVAPTTDLSVPFGTVIVGSSSTQTVTVKNTGTANLLVGAVNSANPLAAPFSIKTDTCSNQTIAPSATCTLTVAFTPTSTGSSTDSFNIPSNDPAKSTITMNVNGTGGTVPVPKITVTDSVAPTNDLLVPFGTIAAGSSVTQTVTVTNSGNAALAVGTVGSTNVLSAPFSIKTDTCSNQTIAPSATCTLTVAFAPTATGTFTDSLNIPSDDPNSASVTVSVSGTGAAAAVGKIKVTDSVTPIDDLLVPFGDVREGRSIDDTVTVANIASGQLVIGSIGSTNPLAGSFSIITDNCSGKTLASGENCAITVRFSPPQGGCTTPATDKGGIVYRCPSSDSFDIPSNDPDAQAVTVQTSAAAVVGRGNNAPSKPRPKYPANLQQGLDTSIQMEWLPSADPDGDTVTYELQVSTDQAFSSTATTTAGATPAGKAAGLLYAGTGMGFIFFGFAFIGTARGRKGILLIAVLVIMVGTTLVSCSASSTSTPQASDVALSRQVSGLQSTTTYYWKIIASDGNGGVTESDVSAFSTK